MLIGFKVAKVTRELLCTRDTCMVILPHYLWMDDYLHLYQKTMIIYRCVWTRFLFRYAKKS